MLPISSHMYYPCVRSIHSGGEIAGRVRQQEETAAQKDAELENEKASVRLQMRQTYATLRG